MTTILPENMHTCDIGGSASIPLGTIRQCGVCKTWWYTKNVYQGFGFGAAWIQVRWYHFRIRRTIKNATR